MTSLAEGAQEADRRMNLIIGMGHWDYTEALQATVCVVRAMTL